MQARNKETGALVSGDEAALNRMGPAWQILRDARPAPAKKAQPKRSKNDN